jgi:murein L,D-transpeptidase YafK
MRRVALIVIAVLAATMAWAHWPQQALDPTLRADRVVLHKSARELVLLRQGLELKRYAVSLGGNPLGHKQREGDERTPEGQYVLDYRNPKSSFYRSLHISYPNAADKNRAKQAGYDPGGMVMIHGLRRDLGWLGRLHRITNWTNGCVAVTNLEMDELWGAIQDGTPMDLVP